MKAVNIYTHEEAEVVKVEGRVYHLRRCRRVTYGDLIALVDYSDLWDVEDFFKYWRTEGSRDYDRAVRHKRQKAQYEKAVEGLTRAPGPVPVDGEDGEGLEEL